MTFAELKQSIIDICQPFIDAYEQEVANFNAYAEKQGLSPHVCYPLSSIDMSDLYIDLEEA